MKRFPFSICVALGALLFAGVAVAAPPATMSSEVFNSTGGPDVVACSGAGNFSFTASGVATGPYAGTFTETGTGTVSSPFTARVTALSADFVVYSPAGDVLVRGTKQLDTTAENISVGCFDGSHFGGFLIPTSYDATIFTAGGNYQDTGTSFISTLFSGASAATLSESFRSSLSEPTLIAPTDKAQCKDRGWHDFPQFKNQGDCVSFVTTGGQNQPAN